MAVRKVKRTKEKFLLDSAPAIFQPLCSTALESPLQTQLLSRNSSSQLSNQFIFSFCLCLCLSFLPFPSFSLPLLFSLYLSLQGIMHTKRVFFHEAVFSVLGTLQLVNLEYLTVNETISSASEPQQPCPSVWLCGLTLGAAPKEKKNSVYLFVTGFFHLT